MKLLILLALVLGQPLPDVARESPPFGGQLLQEVLKLVYRRAGAWPWPASDDPTRYYREPDMRRQMERRLERIKPRRELNLELDPGHDWWWIYATDPERRYP